jgi:dihydroorotase
MSKKNIVIQGGRIIDPASQRDEIANLYIRGKSIVAIGQTEPDGFVPHTVVDAKDKWVFPGVVDLAANLREPGQEYKAEIATETRAAAHAGITCLCCMPEKAIPIESMPTVNLIRKRGKVAGYSHIKVIGAITKDLGGEQLTNMGGLKYAGCVGVSNNREPFLNTHVLRMSMEYAATYDLTLFLHPIDQTLAAKGCAHEGAIATRMGLPAIPVAAETTALAKILALVEQTGVRTHICRLSTANSVKLIAQAKQDKLPVTADVAAHQLFLTDMDICDFNPLCHVQPPLRTNRDMQALRQGVADGTIDVICSDHQPHEIDAKMAPFQQTESGISALETLLPLTLRLVEEKVMSLHQALASVTQNPARIICTKKGMLQQGNKADFVIYDPDELWEFKLENMQSQGKNTPFSGWNFNGKVSQTYIKGKQVQ